LSRSPRPPALALADDATLTQLRHATALARGKKVKKNVDTRASKGRKIRYHVHEKVQNFMIPIEAGASAVLCSLRRRRRRPLSSPLSTFSSLGTGPRFRTRSSSSHTCFEHAPDALLRPLAGTWHEEQVDELFASLLGRSFPQQQSAGAAANDAPALDPALDDVAPARAGQIDVGSLRLFG